MSFRANALYASVLSAVLLSGCTGLEKSSNPLSPTVAGPIPGVNIGQPVPLDPKDGRNIDVGSQPITLTISNAQTNGVRPLSYSFEIATDTSFNTRVFIRDSVTPGPNGQTALKLSDALATGRTYYWRSRAYDGANTGLYSGTAHFTIFTPIVIGKPGPQHPINNIMLSDDSPSFGFVNAPRQGPVGPFTYIIEVADDDAFGAKFAIWQVPEQPNVTTLDSPAPLPGGRQYFWHTRASDGANVGPWSDTQVFRVPAPVVVPPPGSGGGGGDGHSGHIPAGPATYSRAKDVILGTGTEFPSLTSQGSSEPAGVQLLLRMIWHLQQAGFQAGRQKNPSGAISGDKLSVFHDGGWHAYDVISTRATGPLDIHMDEVFPVNYQPDPGIPD